MSFTNSPCGDIQFTTANFGWAVCAGDVYRTVDKGNSWIKQELPSVLHVVSLYFSSEMDGHVVATSKNSQGNTYAATHDGGANWTVTPLPDGFIPHDVCFLDKNIGWVGGGVLRNPPSRETIGSRFGRQDRLGAIASTNNAGKTWQVYSTEIPAICYSLRVLSDKTVYAIFSNQEFGANEVIQEVAYFEWINRGRPEGCDIEIWNFAEQKVRSSYLLRRSGNGSDWTIVYQFENAFLWWLSVIDNNVVWLGGTKLFRTLNGGLDWRSFDKPGVGCFVSDIHGCIGLNSGYSGPIAHTDNGGDSWNIAHVPANTVAAIRFRDEKNAYAAAGNYSARSSPFQTEDGGRTWHELARL